MNSNTEKKIQQLVSSFFEKAGTMATNMRNKKALFIHLKKER